MILVEVVSGLERMLRTEGHAALLEECTENPRLIGNDSVNAHVNHHSHILRIVYSPRNNLHAEGMSLSYHILEYLRIVRGNDVSADGMSCLYRVALEVLNVEAAEPRGLLFLECTEALRVTTPRRLLAPESGQ